MHVSAIKLWPEPSESDCSRGSLRLDNHRICRSRSSSMANLMSCDKWRRRRKGNKNTITTNNNRTNKEQAASSRNNDNCNYSTTNDFNKINKLLLITYMLLITAATICQSAAQSPSLSSSTTNSGGARDGERGSPLSAFLKSGGASYNQQLPQQQLFAMLTRNGGSSGSGSGARGNRGNANLQQFLNLHEDESDADVDEEDMAALHIPHRSGISGAASHLSSVQSGSLETNGFVSDDGGQYEQAEKALREAAAAANNKYNIDCPKDCKCVAGLFECDKLHLERVPVLPNYVHTL